MAPSPRIICRKDAFSLPSMSSTFWAIMILASLLIAYCNQMTTTIRKELETAHIPAPRKQRQEYSSKPGPDKIEASPAATIGDHQNDLEEMAQDVGDLNISLTDISGQLAAGTCEIVTIKRDSSQPRRTIARQTARCACKKGQIAGTTRASPACVDARIIKTKQWCEMLPCLEEEGCDLLINKSGWTCTQPGGRIKTTTVS